MTWAEACNDKSLHDLPYKVELAMKRRLYFEKGAIEFWYCDAAGFITCHDPTGEIHQSKLCPQFPRQVG
jgi:hypothetical protein